MKIHRCLIADIPQVVLADIVQKILEEANDIEVVGRLKSSEEVQSFITQNSIDILIIGMKNDSLSSVYQEVMNQDSNLIVIGLKGDGRNLVVHINNPGNSSLIKIIWALGKLEL